MSKKNNRRMKANKRNMKTIGMKMTDEYSGVIDVVKWVSLDFFSGEIYVGRENKEGNCYVVVDLTNSGGFCEVTIIGAKYLDEFLSQYRPLYREAVYQNDTLAPAEGWAWV